MVDPDARAKLAQLLEQYTTGQISNFSFEDNIPSSDDLVIHAIYHSMWCFYEDFTEHTASERHAFPSKIKGEFSRWILFLESHEEYEWPDFTYPGVRPIEHGFISRILGNAKKEEKFMQYGEYSVWPFVTSQSFIRAKENSQGRGS